LIEKIQALRLHCGIRFNQKWKLDTGKPAILEVLAAGKVKSAVAENLGKLK
jgi:hypothetical protein